MECAAKEYGDCVVEGQKEVDVLFLYRDKYGGAEPDKMVKVCMCSAHHAVLEKIHEEEPLKMRGEEVEWAIHDDLLGPFSHKHNTYTYLKMWTDRTDGTGETAYKYCVVKGTVHGRNIEKFLALMYASDPEISYISEEAIFLIDYSHRLGGFGVVEMKAATSEYDLAVLKNLTTYYEPVSEMKVSSGSGWMSVEPRVEENPTLATEYSIETLFPCVNEYYAQKCEDKFRACFEECLRFMENIAHLLVDIKKLRETSAHSEEELLGLVGRLTDALCRVDRESIAQMKEAGEITEEVLWVTYVLANHELYWSELPGRNLRKNIPLIKLFIGAGLHDRLLLLAVSGERERELDIHIRTHHDILHENIYVVRYLVPKYFPPRSVFAVSTGCGVTYTSAYKYYTEFSNTMYNCNPFSPSEKPFEKNQDMLLHFLKCIVEENTAFLEKTGFEEALIHKERQAEYETLSAKIKEEKKKWGSSATYYEKEELAWKTALENEGE